MQITGWKRQAAVLAITAWTTGCAAYANASEPASADMGTGQRYSLHLYHLHTGESLDVVYRIGNSYVPDALAKLNYFLRDHRTNDVSA